MRFSDNFSSDEFQCHSGEDMPPEIVVTLGRLCRDVLQPIRDAWGSSLVVVSGWRSAAWNTRIGGAAKSQHVLGLAADIRTIGNIRGLELLRSQIERMVATGALPALGGLGWYPGRWIHVDAREITGGHLARWEGRGIGSEVVG